MKKTYQMPSTLVLNVMTGGLLAGSIDIMESEADNEALLLSREQKPRRSLWDDDEEDF